MGDVLSVISSAIIEGKKDDIGQLTQQGLNEGLNAKQILDDGLMKGMEVVGVRFKAGDMFVPEVMRCARTMLNAMELLDPLLAETGARMVGKVLMGTVKGDLHDIGKNLVGMMCRGAGFQVKDIGISVEPEAFVEAVKEFQPDIVGMSALLTTTMRAMGDTIKALEEAGIRDSVKIMVGGAPVTKSFAEKIGANGYAPNAAAAADLAKKFVAPA
jgi:5-methyltetrahydrofolate--homocysteine methyltransferase